MYHNPSQLTLADVRAGFWRLLPLSLFVAAFGLAFGLAGVQAGLSGLEIVVMSAAVFAGTAQFAALDLWGLEVPLLPLLATTFAINARMLLMGASLYPWLRQVPRANAMPACWFCLTRTGP
ncbi:AzlC family ABC transporter permease [Kineobactrum salinum]|uniref:AzlC family ABC transporter permease n=1 Tax=Kineobactrum salinum TaxID=2708301 RepID=UPI001E57534F|nr:AzlC family ABC transporter permease [Kineobactrum salinum]